MDNSIGLRLYVAARITAGAILGSLGTLFASMGTTSGSFDAFIAGSLIWAISVFVALVVALEGVIVLIEQTLQATQ